MRYASLLLAALFASASHAGGKVPATVDEYALKMALKVPAVVDNMQSLGYRKYKTQRVEGRLFVAYYDEASEPAVWIEGLVNKSYRIRGECVTYETEVEGAMLHAVGSNKTGRFKTTTLTMSIEADPSYNVGDDEPDNTLLLVLSGQGPTPKTLSGHAAGQLGCGCRAYGHTSPTRIVYWPYLGSKYAAACFPNYWYPTVVDIAPCWGTWRAKFKSRFRSDDVSCRIRQY